MGEYDYRNRWPANRMGEPRLESPIFNRKFSKELLSDMLDHGPKMMTGWADSGKRRLEDMLHVAGGVADRRCRGER